MGHHEIRNLSCVLPSELQRVAVDLLVANGADGQEAESVAAALVWADTVDRPSQGVSRLDILIPRLRKGLLRSPCNPEVTHSRAGAIRISGHGGFGHHLATLGMRQAIEAAASQGMAVTTVSDSNYFGAAGYYAQLAAEAGMIGLAASNSYPKVAAHGGTRPVLGTNPLAAGIPRSNGRHILLDMATAAAAGSTVRELQQAGNPLPSGTAVGEDGAALTDPGAIDSGALLPFGGAKGYGLGLVVEILCGVLSGAGIAGGVGSLYRDFDRSGNNGHFLAAIDVGAFMDAQQFASRLDMLVGKLRESSTTGVAEGVRYPGERCWAAAERHAAQGIHLASKTHQMLDELAAEHAIPIPWR